MFRFFVSVLIISKVYSFPDGAPLEHCGDMLPGHHAQPIEGYSPFSISVTQNQDKTLNVTIVSEEDYHFKGFLMEARLDLDREEAIGSWDTNVMKTKTINCFGLSNVTEFNQLFHLIYFNFIYFKLYYFQSAVTHHLKHDKRHLGHDHDQKYDHYDSSKHKKFFNPSFTWTPPQGSEFYDKPINFM